MLCSCYGDGDGELPHSVLRSDWVKARLNATFALEKARFVAVGSPRGEDASIACYADANARRQPLARVALRDAVLVGDDGRRLKVLRRAAPSERESTLVVTLRFDTLEAKLGWWRSARDAARDAALSGFAAGRRRCDPPRGPPRRAPPAGEGSDALGLKDALRACREAEERRANGEEEEEEEEEDRGEAAGGRDDGGASAADGARRPSEAPPEPERTVVWESHGMCVCENSRGETSIEPRYAYVAKLAYSRLLRAFIRPPRATYDASQLGPKTFVFEERTYCRRDRECRNGRGRIVRYSIWKPLEAARASSSRRSLAAAPGEGPPSSGGPCAGDGEPRTRTVVYAHGNASSRVEGLSQLSLALHLGCQFVALDCCGSGQSDGEYVSLGYKERDDVHAVLEHERRTGRGVGSVALWGRSMGAVTALLVASTLDPSIDALVLDSAFSSLRALSLDVVARGASSVPTFLARAALRWVRSGVRDRADFDIFDVDPLRYAPECDAAAFFICAADDQFVEPKHSALLHDALASPAREMCVCPGAHNSTRPLECYARAERFLRRVLYPGGEHGGDADPTWSEAVDDALAPLVAPSRRDDRPNFAALPPWTVENLLLRAKQRSLQADVAASMAKARAAVDDPPAAPRWLEDAVQEARPAHDAAVEDMQNEARAVADLL